MSGSDLTMPQASWVRWSTAGKCARGEVQPFANASELKSARSLTFAAVDIQLLMLWCPLRACAPVGVPRRLWCEAECD